MFDTQDELNAYRNDKEHKGVRNVSHSYECVDSLSPVAYRLARKPDGELVLQGAFQWSHDCAGGIEWREIPTHVIE